MRSGNAHDKRMRLSAVLIFLFTLAVYLPTLSSGFVYDDNFVVMNNMLIRGGAHFSEFFFNNVWSFFAEDATANFYRPLQLVLYRVEYALFALVPWPWHLVNIIFHALNAALVFSLALRVLPVMKSGTLGSDLPGKTLEPVMRVLPALFAALIFALHPVNVEPVAWVSSLSDPLFTFFGLLGFIFYIRSMDDGGEGAKTSRAFIFSLVFFLLSLFSKETAMAFLPLVFTYEIVFVGRRVQEAIKTLIPYAVVAVFYMLIRSYALGGITQKEVTELSTAVALINIFPLFFAYISKILMPMNLSVIYEIDVVTSVFAPLSLLGIVLFSLFVFLFFYFKKTKSLPLSLALMVLPLLPVLYIPAVSVGGFAERYLYLPTVGLALFIAYWFIWFAEEVSKRHLHLGAGRVRLFNSFVVLALVMVSVVFLLNSMGRMRVWKDDLTLWIDAVDKNPESAIAHYNAGTVYLDDGKIGEALWHFQNAGRLDPHYAIAFFNIGSIMARSGRFPDAAHYFKRAIKEDDDIVEFHLYLARAYMAGGRPEEARAALNKLLKEKPDIKEAMVLLEELRNQR